jgi:(p)ppGpp synthase/HD superfamily hydrolase
VIRRIFVIRCGNKVKIEDGERLPEWEMVNMDIVEKALQLASKLHEGQYRKNTDIPYITHPVAVGMLLVKNGYSEEIVAAGILHDTVEDTPITLEEIKKEFGENIAEIVEGSSEPNKSLSWKERKEHTIDFLKTASEDIRAVVCADKLHNIRSIIRDYEQVGEEVWGRFNAGKEQQKWYYKNIVESLGSQSTFDLLTELRNEVNKLFRETALDEGL